MDHRRLLEQLNRIGQSTVLRFWDDLSESGRAQLCAQLRALELDAIPDLVSKYVTGRYTPPIPQQIHPITPLPRAAQSAEHQDLYARALARGKQLLKKGKVGAFLVAGGQGTRLGYDGPKGEYPVTPIKNKPLFQVFAEQLLAHSREAGKTIPWYIMTSEANDAATRSFFQKHAFFGYEPSAIFFFQQGMMPAFSMDGQLLLAAKDSLALSPGGNGGCFSSLWRSGAVTDMKKRGVEHLSVFFVDNPMVHCIDVLFLGLHDLTGSEMSSKATPKAHAQERVGSFCLGDGKLQVIEYSDIPQELARKTNPDGSLAFNSASLGIHAIRVSLVEKLNTGADFQLPWHRAEKKVPCVDELGNPIKPDKPNAVKVEQFIFDAIPMCQSPIVYTTDRAEEFSPVKNAEGADSPATSARDQIRRAARWLKEAGVQVPFKGEEVDAVIEISPLYAATLEQLKARKPQLTIRPGSRVYISDNGIEQA